MKTANDIRLDSRLISEYHEFLTTMKTDVKSRLNHDSVETKVKNETRSKRILPKRWISGVIRSLSIFTDLFVRLKISPNTITLFSLVLAFAAGLLYFLGEPLWAMFAVLLSGAFDILDGGVAARTNQSSRFGALLDSAVDRYSEFFIYLGIALYFKEHWAVWIVFCALFGSFMVSYTRARAEGLRVQCRVGIMQRPERFIIIMSATLIGVLFNVFDTAIICGLAVIALFSNITSLQRILYVRKVDGNLRDQ